MRATIFNICTVLSLFSVAIHAAPTSTLPCIKQPIHGGPGPVCDPQRDPPILPRSLGPHPTSSN